MMRRCEWGACTNTLTPGTDWVVDYGGKRAYVCAACKTHVDPEGMHLRFDSILEPKEMQVRFKPFLLQAKRGA